MKRLLDLAAALAGLVVLSPFFAVTLVLIWLQDRKNPLYTPERVGKDGRIFRMVKLRTMVAGADKTGVSSTSADDMRITRVGHFIRRYKLDELAQLWNVFVGEMSLVGPRPNLKRETDSYSPEERKLLTVRPGVTDFSSIVFSDEGDILKGAGDPDLAYDQLIRPWKSRLGIFYVERRSLLVDIRLILLTLLAILNRRAALDRVQTLLQMMGAPESLVRVAGRHDDLIPHAPPGMSEIVTSRG
jgi:lipopolysaccharide/colanic/teichoic acid biosynthesis glycosyltransferase